MNASMKELTMELLLRYGFQVLGAIAILAVGFLVARWLGGMADQRFQKQQMEPPMRILLVRVIKVLVLAMAFVVALDKFGFSIAPLVAGIGVAGIGVGFALQGVLGNLMAGLTIIFTKPFRVGEYIEINNIHGEGVAIELSTTTLVQVDLSRVGVPHTVDLNAALVAASQVTAQSARVLKDPAPSAGIASVDDTGIKIAVWAWVGVGDVFSGEPELYQSLIEAFRARGIGVPLSTHEV